MLRSMLSSQDEAEGPSDTTSNASGENSATGVSKRGSRSKPFHAPDQKASARGTRSANKAGKRVSATPAIQRKVVPMDDFGNQDSERVVFIDNHTKEAVIELYIANEKSAPMPALWSQFVKESQHARDQIGLKALGSFLSKEESKAISLVNCHHQFPSLVTSKGALRSKMNTLAASQAPRVGGQSTKQDDTEPNHRQDLLDRAKMCRTKAASWEKQAKMYEQAAAELPEGKKKVVDFEQLESQGMTFWGEELPLSRKAMNARRSTTPGCRGGTTKMRDVKARSLRPSLRGLPSSRSSNEGCRRP